MKPGTATALLTVAALVIVGLDAALLWDRQPRTEAPDDPAASPRPPATSPTASSPEPRAFADVLGEVAGDVARLRQLEFETIPDPVLLSSGELRERVRTELDTYASEEAELDERLLRSLGIIPPGLDLREAVTEAVSGQVAGFYDPETGELVVGQLTSTDGLGVFDELTLAHELVHALTDQRIGLPSSDTLSDDAAAALSAVIEGDATLITEEYTTQVVVPERGAELFAELEELGPTISTTGLPPGLERVLLFPYTDGLRFVRAIRSDGGWARVDELYAAPPATTYEILFPERFGRFKARPFAELQQPGSAWTEVERSTFGALDLLAMFEAPAADASRAIERPLLAVNAWAGGQIQMWTAGEETAVGGSFGVTGPALCDGLTRWYAAAFPDDEMNDLGDDGFEADGARQGAVLDCSDERAAFAIAPDLTLAREVLGAT